MNNKKEMSLPLMLVINIITIVLTVSGTYFIANAKQDANIEANRTSIIVNGDHIKQNVKNINDLNHTVSLFSKSEIEVMKNNLEIMKEDIKDLKDNQKQFNVRQEIFYQKMAAKTGITFLK